MESIEVTFNYEESKQACDRYYDVEQKRELGKTPYPFGLGLATALILPGIPPMVPIFT